ncbi:hypothetical protein HYFRA_00007709 [Hymenoscyphus fraxineus]|uniref:Uncharacterized protein n=1 Tax=Hymenoscyphus fraxineus TaxID=746836 RepID=A0A9N9KLH5_9HELO|nr:hypothetical protein HYFRA_00007709 [Hymenoscyphus fraxineus]
MQIEARSSTMAVACSSKAYEPSAYSDRNAKPWILVMSILLPDRQLPMEQRLKAVPIFFDTGASDNITTESFVKANKLPKYPIPLVDFKIYETANSKFIPTHYTVLELRDDENGIKEFCKVTFKIAEKLGGHKLLVGREFMNEQGFRLIRENTPGEIFVLTNAKAKQAALLERTERERKRAEEVRSSASTSTHGANSQGQSTSNSSRTSLSSSSTRHKT